MGTSICVLGNTSKYQILKPVLRYSVKNKMLKNRISDKVFCRELTDQTTVLHFLWHLIRFKAIFSDSDWIRIESLRGTINFNWDQWIKNLSSPISFVFFPGFSLSLWCQSGKNLDCRFISMVKITACQLLTVNTQNRKWDLLPFAWLQKCIYQKNCYYYYCYFCFGRAKKWVNRTDEW